MGIQMLVLSGSRQEIEMMLSIPNRKNLIWIVDYTGIRSFKKQKQRIPEICNYVKQLALLGPGEQKGKGSDRGAQKLHHEEKITVSSNLLAYYVYIPLPDNFEEPWRIIWLNTGENYSTCGKFRIL